MAGFETIVRPMILPNTRPPPAQSVAPADDPEQGKLVISGKSTGTITVSYSNSVSIHRASATESKRQFDTVRVTPSNAPDKPGVQRSRAAGGAAGGDNTSYIDVEVVNKVWLTGSDGKKFTRNYAPTEESGNIRVLRRGVTR